MRNGQNKRMRGRNNGGRKSQNPLTRVYESNGPDVKIRGTASHIAEKYLQLARDAQGSGDPVSAENYYQHAEHYFRIIAAAQEQFRQSQPQFYRPEGESREESYDDDADDRQGHPMMGGQEPSYGREHQQPYPPRENQPYPPRDSQQHSHREQQQQYGREQQQQQQQHQQQRDGQNRPHQQGGAPGGDGQGDIERLPSFITGGAQPQQHGYGQNGHEGQPDRFPLHRRRRRHRGPRSDMPGGSSQGGGDDVVPGQRPIND